MSPSTAGRFYSSSRLSWILAILLMVCETEVCTIQGLYLEYSSSSYGTSWTWQLSQPRFDGATIGSHELRLRQNTGVTHSL